MLNVPRTILAGTMIFVGTVSTACQPRTSPPPAAAASAESQPSAATTISAADLRDILADLEKSHEDKIRLSDWAGTPFLPVAGDFKPFFQNMNKQNKELDGELKAWAKSHKVDLTYHYSNDVAGQALKMMEDRQEKVIRGDKQQDFQRDILMEMASDYDWNACQIKALLPMVKDPGLKDYLQKSLNMFESGAVEIRGLLRRYSFH